MVQLIRIRHLSLEKHPWVGHCGCGNTSTSSEKKAAPKRTRSFRLWKASCIGSCMATCAINAFVMFIYLLLLLVFLVLVFTHVWYFEVCDSC